MEKKKQNNNSVNAKAPYNAPEALVFPGKSTSGINLPNIELPAFNPPVPNRAWTAMRAGVDIDDLSRDDIEEMRFD